MTFFVNVNDPCQKIVFQQYSIVFCDGRRWNVMTEYCSKKGWNLIAAKEAFLIRWNRLAFDVKGGSGGGITSYS